MSIKENIENRDEYSSFIKSALAINGSVTPKVLMEVLAATAYAMFISILSLFFHSFSIPVSPFEYAGLVMGLILVFRVNAGYDRWWEARKIWGTVVNSSRNLGIIICSYVDKKKKKEAELLVRYVAAMPYLMKNNLRSDDTIEEIKHLLDDDMYQKLAKAQHKPSVISSEIADRLSALLASKELSEFSFLQAEQCRETVLDCHGASERILKTPMPFVMAVKSRRFILLFLLILPMAFVDYSIYVGPLVVALVSYALFSLDQIGLELQNPFSKARLSHLPLDNICQTIEENLVEVSEKTFK